MENFLRAIFLFMCAWGAFPGVHAQTAARLAAFSGMKETEALAELAAMIDSADKDSIAYNTFYSQALLAFGGDPSEGRNETLLIPVLEDASGSRWLDEAERQRASWRLASARKNRPGTDFPDFKLLTGEGEGLPVARCFGKSGTIVLFYDPDCGHCLEEASRLAGARLPKGWHVVAVDIAAEPSSAPVRPESFPEQWTVGVPAADLEEEGVFDFLFSPTIFAVDGRGIIVLKDATAEHALAL